MGKLIIIEGSDGSGKETQSKKLETALLESGHNVKRIEFPNYTSQSSALVKMYLNGKFGNNPSDVNAYAASTFYAVDRFASYQTEWKVFYESGGIIIADRYSISNMIHQGSKITDAKQLEDFLTWVEDFEFDKLKLPKPNLILFLDMPTKISKELMKNRKKDNDLECDIHEKDYDYLEKSYQFAKTLAQKYSWKTIPCSFKEGALTIDEIHQNIFVQANSIL
ncbi:MAG: deoxynucleoside kinase [Fusobacteria bacterium]|nr:deoxynucleoside kinase [Fusobacteriota bacterium]